LKDIHVDLADDENNDFEPLLVEEDVPFQLAEVSA